MGLFADEGTERGVVGTLANWGQVDPGRTVEVLGLLGLEGGHFGRRHWGDTFAAIAGRVRTGAVERSVIEAALVSSQAVREAGGGKWLAATVFGQQSMARPALLEAGKLIRRLATRRACVEQLKGMIRGVEDTSSDFGEVLEIGTDGLLDLVRNDGQSHRTLQGELVRTMGDLESSRTRGGGVALRTGITELDKAIGGFQSKVVTMLGALPGVGKSALLATFVENLASRGVPVGLLSLEDQAQWLVRRLLARRARVSVFSMNTSPLTDEQFGRCYEAAGSGLYEAAGNVLVDDREGLSPVEVARSARGMIRAGARVILVDHVGEIELPASERNDLELRKAIARLRSVAKDADVPVVVAAHLKRRDGMGVSTAPELTDFAGGSACERMARVALGLSKVKGPDGKVDARKMRISVLKQTQGPADLSLELDLDLVSAMVTQ